jgi:hypothetical protein
MSCRTCLEASPHLGFSSRQVVPGRLSVNQWLSAAEQGKGALLHLQVLLKTRTSNPKLEGQLSFSKGTRLGVDFLKATCSLFSSNSEFVVPF